MKLLNDITAEFNGKVLKNGANMVKDKQVNADEVLFEVEADVNSMEDDDEEDDAGIIKNLNFLNLKIGWINNNNLKSNNILLKNQNTFQGGHSHGAADLGS